MAVPERFSMRAEGRHLLLWREDGWSSAETLTDCVEVAVAVAESMLRRGPGVGAAPNAG
jgi:hypothetical protein